MPPEGTLCSLRGVDKFEPVSGRREMGHAGKAVGQLGITGGDGPAVPPEGPAIDILDRPVPS